MIWRRVADFGNSNARTIIIGFMAYFMDNILLTAVVPVVPSFLQNQAEKESNGTETEGEKAELQGSIGVLFASRSLVQLVLNPSVGYFASKFGYKCLIYAGTGIYAVSSLMFALCDTYIGLFIARSIHGVASAIAIIGALSFLALTYSDDEARSRAMGFALGGMAVGVLVGYPLGGLVYGFVTKCALFLSIFAAILICGAFQYFLLRSRPDGVPASRTGAWNVKTYLKDMRIMLCLLSIGISTSAIATLEPCLPIWLHTSIKPTEWQLGTAFLPDSFGYLIGTNLFGIVSLKLGRRLCAFMSHVSITLSLFMIPFSTKMTHLILPHFGVGLGIAVIDASLMPYLALLVERRGTDAAYTTIYALSQTSVCCAYAFGPFIGAWLMAVIGFRGMLWGLATLNFFFSPFTFFLRQPSDEDENNGMACGRLLNFARSDAATIVIGFLANFMDNILLTAVVPVIPDFLKDANDAVTNGTQTDKDSAELSGRIGLLFASRSIVQLVVNPFVGFLAAKFGYKILILGGSGIFAFSSAMFAFCETFIGLLVARSIHGVASAVSIVGSLSILASTYTEDESRSSAMGFAFGGIAIGELIGYPLGGFVYGFLTKRFLFVLILGVIGISTVIQYILLRLRPDIPTSPTTASPWNIKIYLTDLRIILCLLSLIVSTASISTLDPCLPIYLGTNIKPKEWEIGISFLPESISYMIGANLFGIIAGKFGRRLCIFSSHAIIAISLFAIPFSTAMLHFIGPNIGIGLALAVIDVSITPFLPLIIEQKGVEAVYTTIYALSQTAICLAYALGPFVGAFLMGTVGFRSTLWSLAFWNILFCPLALFLKKYLTGRKKGAVQHARPTNYRRVLYQCINFLMTPSSNKISIEKEPLLKADTLDYGSVISRSGTIMDEKSDYTY